MSSWLAIVLILLLAGGFIFLIFGVGQGAHPVQVPAPVTTERLFYTLDYMLAQTKEWKQDMWVRHGQDPQNPWFSKCWQYLNSLETALMRAVEAEAEQ